MSRVRNVNARCKALSCRQTRGSATGRSRRCSTTSMLRNLNIYWDSSAPVKLYVQELDSAEFRALAVALHFCRWKCLAPGYHLYKNAGKILMKSFEVKVTAIVKLPTYRIKVKSGHRRKDIILTLWRMSVS